MKRYKNLKFGGIQHKIFNLVLIVIILMIAAYTAVIYYQVRNINRLVSETTEKQEESIGEISGQTMSAVIESSLTSSSKMQATISDDLFQNLQSQVYTLGESVKKIFENPDEYYEHPFSVPDISRKGQTYVQTITEDGIDLDEPVLNKKLGLVSNLNDTMCSVYNNTNLNSYFIALPEGAVLITDDRPEAKITEDGDVLTLPVRERPWYVGAEKTGRLFFTDVEEDAFTGQIGIVCSFPVYVGGELVAIVGADMFLDSMSEAIASSENEGSFMFIINEKGHVVFSPAKEGLFQVKASDEAIDLRGNDNLEFSNFINETFNETVTPRLLEVEGTNYYMSGSPMATVGWAVISVARKDVVDQPTKSMMDQFAAVQKQATDNYHKEMRFALLTIVILVLVIMALAIIGALVLAKRIVKPLERITERVHDLGGDDLQFCMEDAYKTGDEIEILAESFAMLSAKTLEYVAQVTKVTAEKERIGAELSVATNIQASQLPRLFPAFPQRPEFDLYASMTPAKEVGGDFYDFFLVDNDHVCLVMADVSGKGVPAALFMMISRVLIKARIQNGEPIDEAISNVNNQLCEGNEAELFVTVWAAVIEISTGRGEAINAGHEHPCIRRAGGEFELEIYRHSVAVATMEDMVFKKHEFQLNPGDSLFVYTDGVAEATDSHDELFGNERMLKALNKNPDASPKEVLENVMDGINEFVAGAEQFDDITMLCMKYTGV
ncbi:MAG: SpoIIE family protein phosphatase [Eubacterium sp.]|nr:SpoIIE family protein phosphatase [Eubacterium sp.]